MAFFSPSWWSEITSLSPCRPRARRPRKNSVQNASDSTSPMSGLRDGVGDDQGLADDAATVADLDVLGV